MSEFDKLQGKTLIKIEGAEKGSERIVFTTNEGDRYAMYHSDDCCETVQVEDICGAVDDLIGHEILSAYESTNEDDKGKPEEYTESWTWTFYNISTIKGSVTLRWLGESNGYYSETPYFEKMEN